MFKFECSAVGNTVPQYRWLKDGIYVSALNYSGVFVIDSLRKTDAGLYSCIAFSEVGNIISNTLNLNAYGKQNKSVHL